MEDNTKKIIKETIKDEKGKITFRKYIKNGPLGENEKNFYEFICSENNEIFTAKIIPKTNLVKAEQKEKLIEEIKIQKSCNHPNIASLLSYFEDEENVYILYENCKNGSLSSLLNRRKKLTELEVQCYLIQLIRALIYLHKFRIIHRNLKLQNILLTEKMELKLIGFNLSIRLKTDEEKANLSCGTPIYIAPEIIEGKEGYSFEVDIWALGIIIYELIIGKPPFSENDVKSTYEKIKKVEYTFPEDSVISNDAKNLISQILVKEPNKRLSLEQILNHDFFKQGSIPNLLPSSTLTTTPSLNYIRQFIPNVNEFGIIVKEELKAPEIYVAKFIDFSSKYGLGYILSNGFCGVYFNDATKIILNPNTNIFYYLEREIIDDKKEILNSYNLNNYPNVIKKKVILLEHFKNYLLNETKNEDIIKTKKMNENNNENEPFTYVKKWTRTKHSVFFILPNKKVQFIFNDKTELILSSGEKLVVYVDKNKSRSFFHFSSAMESSNKEMVKRLDYAKQILEYMLNKNKENKNNIHEDIEHNYISKQLTTFDSFKNIREEDKIKIEFTSVDQTINNLSILCLKTDNFSTIRNLLLKEYSELKNSNFYFLANGNVLEETKTIEENKIKNDSKILIADQNSFYF